MVRQFIPRRVHFQKMRATSKTVPEQSLTINEIVAKYTRGIPVNTVIKKPIYSDQTDFDLEKLSRMEFDQKAALAAELREQAQQTVDEAQERARAATETQRRSEQASTDEDDDDEQAPRKTSKGSRKNPSEKEGSGNDKP